MAICSVDAGRPIALIGAGGIGKTSIALALLNDDRIKDKFGVSRRFLRCDEVQSHSHFLSRISKVTGAGIEDTSSMMALRPFLSSNRTIFILDNAETILDPHTPEAPALYTSIEELSRIKTISLVIATRTSMVPATCKNIEIPALSVVSAREAFYNIYTNQESAPEIDPVLQQLDHHPLSITVLATVASQNRWDHSRLLREWDKRRVSLLQIPYTPGLSAVIESSLSSPMFTSLGPDARDILGVIAILPQGVSEAELEWIFPTVSDIRDIVDTLIILSLIHWSDGFVTMLAPFREYFKADKYSCPLFVSTKNQYLTRLGDIARDSGHGRVRPQDIWWLVSEEVNVKTLLTLSVEVDPESQDIQRICLAVKKILDSTSLASHPMDNTTSSVQADPDTHYYPRNTPRTSSNQNIPPILNTRETVPDGRHTSPTH